MKQSPHYRSYKPINGFALRPCYNLNLIKIPGFLRIFVTQEMHYRIFQGMLFNGVPIIECGVKA